MLQAAILAAGESRRMGAPKALLPDSSGRAFVARVVRTLRAAGADDVLVVTGSQHQAIADALIADGLEAVKLVRNPDPSRGQLSSIWTALDACPPAAEALLLTLVDVPMIAIPTVTAVLQTWRETRAPVVRPVTRGRRGHPVIFDRAVFAELRAAPLDEGARVVVRAHWSDAIDVPVDDPGCLVDVDTPADYEQLRHGIK